MKDKIIQELNNNLKGTSLSGTKKIINLIQKRAEQFKKTEEVNSHVHTIYSLSPYSPSITACLVWKAGLLNNFLILFLGGER